MLNHSLIKEIWIANLQMLIPLFWMNKHISSILVTILGIALITIIWLCLRMFMAFCPWQLKFLVYGTKRLIALHEYKISIVSERKHFFLFLLNSATLNGCSLTVFDQERYHRNYLHPLLDRGYRIYSATNGRYSLFILSIFLFLSFGVLDKTRSLNTALGDDSLFCESGVG